ncbi:MAG: glycine dehydrogenase (aminomethyl-transferring), partial [Burkholderiales bacterium]|nr:glycine dehydrogenase (aminomethyl-transferring) [Burkholderiales bacterium]
MTTASLSHLEDHAAFVARHIGPNAAEEAAMLATLGYATRSDLIKNIVPTAIARADALPLGEFTTAKSEAEALATLKAIAGKNILKKNFIGQGYYGTHTPSVILRNILENPAWYTAYTPYQPEISQGRLEAIINFQQMICDMTGMAIANASMLDEGTAAAEAMTLLMRMSKSKSTIFYVAADVLPQTREVIATRAAPLGIEVRTGLGEAGDGFGVLLQYPGVNGDVPDYRNLVADLHAKGTLVVVATDLLALTLLAAPGEWGADVVVGNSQRFGVPLGFGGPHAGFLATRDEFKRSMPGRLVGITIDAQGKSAYRLALQTREQHIRREKATSNICTAQVLLAVMASMYAVYHGPAGLKRIAHRVHRLTSILAAGLKQLDVKGINGSWFDTLTISVKDATQVHALAYGQGLNLRQIDASTVGISLDETSTREDIAALWHVFADGKALPTVDALDAEIAGALPGELLRQTDFLTHPTFNRYHSETEMMRYLRGLADKDLALDRTMIPLGSCTMKLNAASEMMPVTWPEFANVHPFAPNAQTAGY